MPPEARVPLPGSDFVPPPGAQPVGPVEPHARVEVSVILRPQRSLDELQARLNQPSASPAPALSREEYAARYGADPNDVAAVEAFAREYGLEVMESSPARRTVRLAGTAAQVGAAFGVQLEKYRQPHNRSFRAHRGSISLPAALAGSVQGVFGLDTQPIARRG